MQRGSLAALFFTGLMVLSGCFGAVDSGDDENQIEEPSLQAVLLAAEWDIHADSIQLDGTPVQLTISVQSDDPNWDAQPTILTPQGEALTAYEWDKDSQGLQLIFTPTTVGDYSIQVDFTTLNDAVFIKPVPELVHTIRVVFPNEEAPILSAPVTLSLDDTTVIWFEGGVNHSALSSCTLQIFYGLGLSKAGNIKDDGTWKILIDLSLVTDF